MARVRAATVAGRLPQPVVVVLEGAARSGVEAATADGVTVAHAPASGDEALVAVIEEAGGPVTLVSADRALRERATALGAEVANPGWLIEVLDR